MKRIRPFIPPPLTFPHGASGEAPSSAAPRAPSSAGCCSSVFLPVLLGPVSFHGIQGLHGEGQGRDAGTCPVPRRFGCARAPRPGWRRRSEEMPRRCVALSSLWHLQCRWQTVLPLHSRVENRGQSHSSESPSEVGQEAHALKVPLSTPAVKAEHRAGGMGEPRAGLLPG